MNGVRKKIISRLKKDLIGPYAGKDEIIEAQDGPEKEYLVAKLFPKNSGPSEDSIEAIIAESRQTDSIEEPDVSIEPNFDKVSSAGISFYIKTEKDEFSISIVTEYARYKMAQISENELIKILVDEGYINNKGAPSENSEGKNDFKREQIKEQVKNYFIEDVDFTDENIKKFHKRLNKDFWKRKEYSDRESPFVLSLKNSDFDGEISAFNKKHESLSLVVKSRMVKGHLSISLFMTNELDEGGSYNENQENTLFQFKFSITAQNAIIAPIPNQISTYGSNKINDFMYRNNRSYAVGHTCSSGWSDPDSPEQREVFTSWIPEFYLPDVSALGHEYIRDINLNAKKMSLMSKVELINLLNTFLNAYTRWVEEEKKLANKLSKEFKEVFDKQESSIKHIILRIRHTIDFLDNDSDALESFKLANKAMYMQGLWVGIENYEWRPFQLGFLLLTLEPTLNRKSKYRDEVDLLWFPTGGGKTEAAD